MTRLTTKNMDACNKKRYRSLCIVVCCIRYFKDCPRKFLHIFTREFFPKTKISALYYTILYYTILYKKRYQNINININMSISCLESRKRRKVRILIHLSDDIDEKLRKFIALKYQKVQKGLLSYEVEQAIRNHICVYNIQQSTQARPSDENQYSRVSQLRDQIILYLIEVHGVENPKGIIEKHLDESIGRMRGIDPRTIKNWKQRFLEYGCIRKSGSHYYDFL